MKKILVVDDNDITLSWTCLILENAGYNAIKATNGGEALIELGHHHPDLVILDLMTPGVNGWEFLDSKGRIPDVSDVPVVIISAYTEVPQPLPEVAVVMRKPATKAEILDAVSAVLGE